MILFYRMKDFFKEEIFFRRMNFLFFGNQWFYSKRKNTISLKKPKNFLLKNMIIFRIVLVDLNNQIRYEISIRQKVIFILWYNVFYSCVLFLKSSLTDSVFQKTFWTSLSCSPVIFIYPSRKTSFFFHWPTFLFKRLAGFLETLLLLTKLIHLIMPSTFLTILIWNVNRIVLPLIIKTKNSLQ